jgi:hypothetical protein
VAADHILSYKADGLKNPLAVGQLNSSAIFWDFITLGVECQTKAIFIQLSLTPTKDRGLREAGRSNVAARAH